MFLSNKFQLSSIINVIEKKILNQYFTVVFIRQIERIDIYASIFALK